MRSLANRRSIPLGLVVLAVLVGCGSGNGVAPTTRPGVRVAAASDLQAALPAIIDRFRTRHAIEIEPVFGSSGQLAKQIGQGGPFDLFLSANRGFVEELASKGVIDPASVHPYARGILVGVVNLASNVSVQSLADLAKPEVKKIAIANPAFAPYGLAASQVFERSKLAEAIAPKIVMADSVRHALQFVQTGNAEAGLVALSVASVPEVRTIVIDAGLYDPIVQYQGIVARSENKAAAILFAEFLRSEEGQRILKSFGFAEPPRDGPKPPSSGASP